MIQKMMNLVTINVHGIDLYSVTDIEVCLTQGSTELIYSGQNIQIGNESQLLVSIPKSVAMNLDCKLDVSGQIMWKKDGIPDASKIFLISVRKLLKEAGYGD